MSAARPTNSATSRVDGEWYSSSGVPTCSSRPRDSIAIRSATANASS